VNNIQINVLFLISLRYFFNEGRGTMHAPVQPKAIERYEFAPLLYKGGQESPVNLLIFLMNFLVSHIGKMKFATCLSVPLSLSARG